LIRAVSSITGLQAARKATVGAVDELTLVTAPCRSSLQQAVLAAAMLGAVAATAGCSSTAAPTPQSSASADAASACSAAQRLQKAYPSIGEVPMDKLDAFIVSEQRLADQAAGYDPQWHALDSAVNALASANTAFEDGPGSVEAIDNAWGEVWNQCTGVGSSLTAGAS
jgi:hypothetical protein